MKMYKPKQMFWNDDLTDYENWVTEIKYDGERNLLIIKDGDVKIQRHEGRIKSEHYPEIIDYVKSSKLINRNITLDGEICVLVSDIKADFPSIANRQTRNKEKQKTLLKTKPVTFVAFDIVEFNDHDLTNEPFGQRRKMLEKQDLSNIVDFKKNNVVIIKSGSEKISESLIKKHDLEGAVMKNPCDPNECIKLKNYDEDEFEIIGTEITEARKKKNGFISALRLQNKDGRYVGDCTYINYPQTQEFKDAIIGKKVLVRFMKTDAYREGKGKLRFPVMQKIMEEYSDA